MNISFIGYGNIAQAMAKNLSHQSQYHLRAAAPSLPIGVDAHGVHTHSDNLAILNDADAIIIAVKPAQVAAILTQIQHAIPSNGVVLSVASGLRLARLASHCLEQQPIVRAMPNTPISIGKGAIPLIANPWVSEVQKERVTQLFQSMGMSTWLTDENDMDRFTAVSGSGPAYVFFFLEAMMHAAEQLGLDKEVAKTFSLQTMYGAVELARLSGSAPQDLRQNVTSPGGTTAAAIQILQEAQFEHIVFKAMDAALKRSKELGEAM